MKGKLIVIEGTDGSGKETQSKLLVEYLNKNQSGSAKYIEFPQYGKPSAVMVEEYLNGRLGSAQDVSAKQASILYAVDRFAASSEIKEWLSKGKTVICNRYTTANKGHQAGKILQSSNQDTISGEVQKEVDTFLDWIDELEYSTFAIPKPDYTVLLYMPHKVGQKLVAKKAPREYIGGKEKDIHEADDSHLRAAEAAYLYVANKDAWSVINCAESDEPLPIETIHSMVKKELHF